MNQTDETVIELSRWKAGLYGAGAFAFAAAGVWMLTLDAADIRAGRAFRYFFNSPAYVYGLGLAAVLLFGLLGLYAVRAFFDRRPGLVLDSSGVTDNASAIAAGFIPWSEVLGMAVLEMQGQKMLIINVADPLKYVARGGALKRLLNKANYKFYGSPIFISAITLKTDFGELLRLFGRYQRRYCRGMFDAPSPGDVTGGAFDDDAYEAAYGAADERPGARLFNWSPTAVQGTVGAGGVGILVLLAASLDNLFQIKLPFWGAAGAGMLPALVFFVAVPDFLPERLVRPAQWFAVAWYLAFAALSVSLAAARGLDGVDLLLVGFILVGAAACLVALRGLRASRAGL